MEGQGQVRRPCAVQRNRTAHAEEAAQALLRCPLPPQLEVSYKNSSGVPPLRSSVSESNVSINTGLLSIRPAKSAFRTFSDGQSSNSQFRRKLESEDSSYDSDHDCACFPTLLPQHDDVSRTASDTLDLELRDDATTAGSKIGDAESSDTEIAITDCINFYKFAVKLGYSEQQASIVLKKLGSNPVLDEFLNGLIQLDKLNSSSQAITTGAKCEEILEPLEEAAQLRYIVIDGSNVAMTHGNKEKFSCRGIQICVDWFLSRGHTNLMVLVPMWRKETSTVDYPITDQHILLELERCKLLTFTPSRQSPDGRRVVCYDDRYILQVARDNDAIVVSNDNYRDLAPENPEFRAIVEKRILMYSFVNDRFMPPDDPLGRNGPKLEKFLRKTVAQPCPYNTRCTYGNKCKYYHPERLNNPQKPISEQLVENALRKLPDLGVKKKVTREGSGMSLSTPESVKFGKKPVQRAITSSPTRSLPLSLVEEWPVRDATHQSPLGFPVVRSVQFSVPPPGLPGEDLLNTHRRVARKASLLAPPYPPPLNFGASSHQQVFRNQSAPYQQLSLSSLVLPTTPQLSSSSSDNQLNLLGSTDHLSPQNISSLDTRVPPPFLGGSMREDLEKKRRNIVFHLKAILPEDLVMKAMYLMPEETDAIKICAAISSLAVSNQKSTSPF